VRAELPAAYEPIRLLRQGEDCNVWDAWSHERGSRCVLKTLRPDRAAHARAAERLRREGRLLLTLSHPHIVRAYELLGEPRPALVLETLAGSTLSRLVDDRGGGLEPVEVAHLGLQLGSAIRYLHSRGTLHVDLKPSNVIAEAGRAKVVDLGLARSPGAAPAGIGTPGYLSPEQDRGERLGPPTDVWGIGVVLLEAATGEAADDGASPPPGALGEAIAACLEPDPASRPSPRELLARIEPLAELPGAERRWQRRLPARA
jgi:serine/threonine protein kinase